MNDATHLCAHRWVRLAGLVAALLALVSIGLAPTAARADVISDQSAAAGFDSLTFAPADIVAGTAHNGVLIHWVFPQTLTDGTLQASFPTHDWPTPLQSVGALNSEIDYTGAAVVRPNADITSSDSTACAWPGSAPDVDRSAVTQVVRVTHVTCAAGQHLDLRLVNVRAPNHAGTYSVQVGDSDATAGHTAILPLRVAPTPAVSLQLSAPRSVAGEDAFAVRITATRGGAVATDYRGQVSLSTPFRFLDCTGPQADQVAHTFTAADAGRAVVQVSVLQAHRLLVRDIADQAQPGRSNWFHITAGQTSSSCPVSYH